MKMLNNSQLLSIIAPISIAGFLGCTVDNVVLLRHPGSVTAGTAFTVGALGVVANVVAADDSAETMVRDSVHFGVGVPAGWDVLSAKVCAAPHFRFLQAAVNGLDTNRRNQLLLDTLSACEGRAAPMEPDAGVEAFLAGRIYRATASPDSLGRPFNVRADTVPQWFGFSARIDLDVSANSPADTILDPKTSPVVAESAALKALPLYVFVTLKAPPKDTSARLLYFSKTGKLDPALKASDVDKGVLVYCPVVVGGPLALRRGRLHAGATLAVLRGPAGLRIRLPAAASEAPWTRLEIRASGGLLLRAWSSFDLERGLIEWDGGDASARPLARGRYLAVLIGGGERRTLPFPILP